jgi:hypothetical protein
MTQHEQLLGALGELQRAQRAELERFEEPARVLAAREPERMPAFEARLLREVCGVTPKPRRRALARTVSFAAASCALVAAALLWVRAPAKFDRAYTLVPPTADAVTRAAQPAAAGGSFTLGRTLTFTLRPAERYSGAVRVLAYATLAETGTLVQLDPKVELDPAGGARVAVATGPGSQLTSPGSWELQFHVAPDSAAAASDAELRARRCPADTRCLTFSARFAPLQGL